MITKEQYMSGCEVWRWFSSDVITMSGYSDNPRIEAKWNMLIYNNKSADRFYTTKEEAELVRGLHKLNEA